MKTTIRTAILLFLCAVPLGAQMRSAGDSPLPANAANKVEKYLREMFAWDASYKVEIGKPDPSPVVGLYEVQVKVSYQGTTDTGVVYLSQDGRYLLRGELDSLLASPFATIRAQLHPEGNPALGPADARVTVVAFSDFECPHCRELYQVMKTLEPRYPQVRFVFKDFPLEALHPWAMTAAIAGRCAYMQRPAAFWKLHDAIFDNQTQITPDSAWDTMIDFAGHAGLDLSAFRACMTSPAAKAAVEANIADGKALHVSSTPTVFVNGRVLVGDNDELLERFVQFDLGPTSPRNPAGPAR